MNAVEVISISRNAIWTLLKVGAPVMLIALIIGLGVSLFQALTQIQEMTLTFVPKIVMIFVTLLVATPFMYGTLKSLSDTVFDLVENGGL